MTKPKKPTPKKTRNGKKFVINRGQVMAVYGNFAEGFQLVGPFTDFEAADAACPTAEWLWSVEPPSDPQTNWANDGIQFARLIAELYETMHLAEGAGAVDDLSETMNLTTDQVLEIIERARQVWNEVKQQVQPPPLSRT